MEWHRYIGVEGPTTSTAIGQALDAIARDRTARRGQDMQMQAALAGGERDMEELRLRLGAAAEERERDRQAKLAEQQLSAQRAEVDRRIELAKKWAEAVGSGDPAAMSGMDAWASLVGGQVRTAATPPATDDLAEPTPSMALAAPDEGLPPKPQRPEGRVPLDQIVPVFSKYMEDMEAYKAALAARQARHAATEDSASAQPAPSSRQSPDSALALVLPGVGEFPFRVGEIEAARRAIAERAAPPAQMPPRPRTGNPEQFGADVARAVLMGGAGVLPPAKALKEAADAGDRAAQRMQSSMNAMQASVGASVRSDRAGDRLERQEERRDIEALGRAHRVTGPESRIAAYQDLNKARRMLEARNGVLDGGVWNIVATMFQKGVLSDKDYSHSVLGKSGVWGSFQSFLTSLQTGAKSEQERRVMSAAIYEIGRNVRTELETAREALRNQRELAQPGTEALYDKYDQMWFGFLDPDKRPRTRASSPPRRSGGSGAGASASVSARGEGAAETVETLLRKAREQAGGAR